MDRNDAFPSITSELMEFEAHLAASLVTDSSEITDAALAARMHQVVTGGGKRLRPALVMLCAHLGDAGPEKVRNVATGLELIHTATLVHDDLIDNSSTRRGVIAVHQSFGSAVAIIVGDYYLSKGWGLVASAGIPELDAEVAQTVMTICAGELKQAATKLATEQTFNQYLEKIAAKTAALLATSCRGGGRLGGVNEELLRSLGVYGQQLGIAFQVVDDILDYTASSQQLGKPAGADLLEGTVTLPLMYALEDQSIAAELRPLLRPPLDVESAGQIVEVVRRSNAIPRATEFAERAVQQAQEALTGLPESPWQYDLSQLGSYVVNRLS